jgi:hypothetical protein
VKKAGYMCTVGVMWDAQKANQARQESEVAAFPVRGLDSSPVDQSTVLTSDRKQRIFTINST